MFNSLLKHVNMTRCTFLWESFSGERKKLNTTATHHHLKIPTLKQVAGSKKSNSSPATYLSHSPKNSRSLLFAGVFFVNCPLKMSFILYNYLLAISTTVQLHNSRGAKKRQRNYTTKQGGTPVIAGSRRTSVAERQRDSLQGTPTSMESFPKITSFSFSLNCLVISTLQMMFEVTLLYCNSVYAQLWSTLILPSRFYVFSSMPFLLWCCNFRLW